MIQKLESRLSFRAQSTLAHGVQGISVDARQHAIDEPGRDAAMGGAKKAGGRYGRFHARTPIGPDLRRSQRELVRKRAEPESDSSARGTDHEIPA
jgi:hypothetical protein